MKHFGFKLFCVLALLGTLSLDCVKNTNKSSQIKVSDHTTLSGLTSIDVLKSIGTGFIAAPFLAPLLFVLLDVTTKRFVRATTGRHVVIMHELFRIYISAALALVGHKVFVVDASYPKVSFIAELAATIMFSAIIPGVIYR